MTKLTSDYTLLLYSNSKFKFETSGDKIVLKLYASAVFQVKVQILCNWWQNWPQTIPSYCLSSQSPNLVQMVTKLDSNYMLLLYFKSESKFGATGDKTGQKLYQSIYVAFSFFRIAVFWITKFQHIFFLWVTCIIVLKPSELWIWIIITLRILFLIKFLSKSAKFL